MGTAPHLEADGLLLIADASLTPAQLEQATPVLARGGVAVHQGPVAGPRRLVLFDGQLAKAHAELLRREPPALLLAARGPGGAPAAWEVRLLSALLRGGPLLPEDAGVTRHRPRRVADIQTVADAAAADLTRAGGSRVAAGLAADVVHELAVNALLDAPVDAQGHPRYAHRRTQVTEVAEEDACELSHGVAEGRLWLEVVDRFGGLRPGPFARTLEGWGERVRVDASGGGAGLGLRRILEHSAAVAVRVVAGRESRVVCVVEPGDARRRATQPKSLLFCLQ